MPWPLLSNVENAVSRVNFGVALKQTASFTQRAKTGVLTASLLGLGLFTNAAQSQGADQYPSKPITIMVPFSAGGTTDILARLLGQRLSQKWGQPVVIENRAGAGGNIGTAVVARAPADGYMLVMGTIGTHTINSSLYKSMPYDPIKDFAPITRVAMVPNALVVNKDAPFDSVAKLVAYAKANPGKLNFGSSGHGTTLHLSGELFKLMAGVQMQHVPYKGSAPAIADLLGGQITMIFDNMPSALPHVKSGRLKALAVTSATRVKSMPDIPTVAEAGIPGFEVTSWFGLWAPANTPPDIVRKLNREVVDILNSNDVKEKIKEQGAEPNPETPEQFAEFIQTETKKWARVVKEAGISID